jgi:hypothetical protein
MRELMYLDFYTRVNVIKSDIYKKKVMNILVAEDEEDIQGKHFLTWSF